MFIISVAICESLAPAKNQIYVVCCVVFVVLCCVVLFGWSGVAGSKLHILFLPYLPSIPPLRKTIMI